MSNKSSHIGPHNENSPNPAVPPQFDHAQPAARPSTLLTEPWVRNSRKKRVLRDLRPAPPARKS
jgi:hypothetical protein